MSQGKCLLTICCVRDSCYHSAKAVSKSKLNPPKPQDHHEATRGNASTSALNLEEIVNEEEEAAAQANGESRAKAPAPRKSKKLTEEEKDRNQRRARNTDKAVCSLIGP